MNHESIQNLANRFRSEAEADINQGFVNGIDPELEYSRLVAELTEKKTENEAKLDELPNPSEHASYPKSKKRSFVDQAKDSEILEPEILNHWVQICGRPKVKEVVLPDNSL